MRDNYLQNKKLQLESAIGSGLQRACSEESFEIRLNPPNTALSLRQTVQPLAKTQKIKKPEISLLLTIRESIKQVKLNITKCVISKWKNLKKDGSDSGSRKRNRTAPLVLFVMLVHRSWPRSIIAGAISGYGHSLSAFYTNAIPIGKV